jgi:hypothetical protein
MSDAEPPAPAPEPSDEDRDEDAAHPFGLFPIIMLIVLVAAGLFVMFELRDVSNIQDCVQSGRRNCAPIDTTNLK